MDRAIAEVVRIGDLSRVAVPFRTVFLVQHAQGIIDNGGLQYFFEMDHEGQPPYSVFIDAYRTIGAETEADALECAVKLFPFSDPHRHQKERNTVLDQYQEEGTGCHRSDSPFVPLTNKLCGNEGVWHLLGQYVNKHAVIFSS